MIHQRHLTPGQFLTAIAIIAYAAIVGLLLVIGSMQGRLEQKQETIRALAKEIRWQRYVAERAERRQADYQELRHLAQVFMSKDRDVYKVARAAWKWGKVYSVSPHLILAVAHRESNFQPAARSFTRDGRPLAYGVMQINLAVWQQELGLDPERMDEVDYNVQHGTAILRRYIDAAEGDTSRALWLYWGGALAGGGYSYPPKVLASRFYNHE
jgi:soluble lytic murein transglycosylase-like protein